MMGWPSFIAMSLGVAGGVAGENSVAKRSKSASLSAEADDCCDGASKPWLRNGRWVAENGFGERMGWAGMSSTTFNEV